MFLPIALSLLIQRQAVEVRVEDLLRQMTRAEKISLLSGTSDFFTKAISRLGIPQFKMSDGPAGVRTFGQSTAYPAPICLAATWDQDLALKVGESYGRDARIKDVDFLLAPGVNIYRIPVNGRNFEYFGEDPYLAGRMAVGFIRGVQSQGVAATVKHFALNNQEYEREKISADADERTIREIYLPAFEAAVKEGGAWAVMASYNRLNGTYTTENDWLLNEVLKKEWGFRGLVMSDWGATHSAAKAANAGLDLEMPGGDFFTAIGLEPAIDSGAVSMKVIDDKVRRLLRVVCSIGAMDRKGPSGRSSDDPESSAIALREAREGVVLLKNRSDLLPLRPSGRIAVIGPNADPTVVGGGGSSSARPFRSVSVLDAIRVRLGAQGRVLYAAGVPPPVEAIIEAPPAFTDLQEERFATIRLEGASAHRQANRIEVSGGGDRFSIRWVGTLSIEQTGGYEFVAKGDDGYRAWIDGKPLFDEWRDQAATSARTTVQLLRGQHTLRFEYYQAEGDAILRFGYRRVVDDVAAAVAAAQGADAAIVCIGLNPTIESEGKDRPYALPTGQDALVRAVRAVNPRTVVVYNGGGSSDMASWVDQVPALLYAWYPGQNGNEALAEILFGDVSPTGKLPYSVERRWRDSPAVANYPGKDLRESYSEGLYVGYRGFDRAKVRARFPFGFGLTYTRFQLLSVRPVSGGDRPVYEVAVKNSGRVAADEIVQAYVAPVHPRVDRPAKELKGFARVHLKPGETKTVRFQFSPRDFAYWSVAKHGWQVDPGDYRICFGDSSDHLPLIETFTVK